MNTMRAIRAAFDKRGQQSYGEGVSQLDHALQCGLCAERDGATPALIVATLLHDIGHMLHDLPEDIADKGIDTVHESLGSAWLSQHFGPEVSEPVRLHVSAKRYLATREKGYYDLLSEASLLSLKLQGGLMSMVLAVVAAGLCLLQILVGGRWQPLLLGAGAILYVGYTVYLYAF